MCTDVVMGQCVEFLPASFFLGGQVKVREDLACGARAPLCGQRRYYTIMTVCSSTAGPKGAAVISVERRSVTQGNALHLRPLRVGQVSVHLIDDLLFHLARRRRSLVEVKKEKRSFLHPREVADLRDGVTVQHLHRGHVRALAVHQHLQGLTPRTHVTA